MLEDLQKTTYKLNRQAGNVRMIQDLGILNVFYLLRTIPLYRNGFARLFKIMVPDSSGQFGSHLFINSYSFASKCKIIEFNFNIHSNGTCSISYILTDRVQLLISSLQSWASPAVCLMQR